MKGHPIPEVQGQQFYPWAQKLTAYLRVVERAVENPAPKAIQLEHAKENAKATVNGLLMWDNTIGQVIVSKDGAWYALDMTLVTLVGIQNKATR